MHHELFILCRIHVEPPGYPHHPAPPHQACSPIHLLTCPLICLFVLSFAYLSSHPASLQSTLSSNILVPLPPPLPLRAHTSTTAVNVRPKRHHSGGSPTPRRDRAPLTGSVYIDSFYICRLPLYTAKRDGAAQAGSRWHSTVSINTYLRARNACIRVGHKHKMARMVS